MAIPHVEVVQDDVVAEGGGAVGAAGAVAEGIVDAIIDDIDDPPPQALSATISKVQVAVGIHRRRVSVF